MKHGKDWGMDLGEMGVPPTVRQEDVVVPKEEGVFKLPADQAVARHTEEDAASSAAIIAELQARLARLEQQTSGAATEQTTGSTWGGYPWMYWRLPNGWIALAQGGRTPEGRRSASIYSGYVRKGMTALEQYGVSVKPTRAGGGTGDGSEFALLISRGGVKEFPISQILAYKWHVTPPVKGVTFPQYEAVKDTVLYASCPDCDFEVWALPDDKQMPRAFFMHMREQHRMSRAEASAEMRDQGLPVHARFAIESDALVREGLRRREEARV